MINILPAFNDSRLVSGTTLVDTSVLSWPGTTFSVTTCADQVHVDASFQLLASSIGVSRPNIHSVHQVHGREVVRLEIPMPNEAADAIISDKPSIVIGVKIADCCAVLIHDPVREVVAAVHSGWRGTALGVLTSTIDRLRIEWGTNPRNLQLYMSACASKDQYEVGRDVYSVLSSFCRPHPMQSNKWLYDNHAALAAEAITCGVDESQIIIEPSCTITDPRFHSHRRDGERAGRCFAFIGLRSR